MGCETDDSGGMIASTRTPVNRLTQRHSASRRSRLLRHCVYRVVALGTSVAIDAIDAARYRRKRRITPII